MKSGMKIPKDEVVLFVIKDVMQNKSEVSSLNEFSDLVNTRLKKVDPRLAISGKRLRQIFVKAPGTRLFVETRKGKVRSKCPSCSSVLKKTHTKNLRGRKVLYKLSCQKCGYKAANGKFAPKRYRFIRR